MRLLIRSYDLDDLAGGGSTLQPIARFLGAERETAWTPREPYVLDGIRAWPSEREDR